MRRIERGLVVLSACFLCHCSSSDSSSQSPGDSSADASSDGTSGDTRGDATSDSAPGGDTGGGDTTADTTVDDSGTDTGVDTTSPCVGGGACSTNPGAPCKTGTISCTDGAPACVDAAAAPEGTTCTGGSCARGKCHEPVTVSTSVDLSTTSVTAGRTCASEAPAFSVVTLASTTATLSDTPTGDCLAPGDEVLLIDLQGAPGATANVGNWELLEVKDVTGADVTFVVAKSKFYGAVVGGDASIGVGATDQKVALVRVPQFGTLTVASGGSLTTGAWSGTTGGVLALRAAALQLDGTISVSGLGYRNGRWSQDNAGCSDNVATEAGESIDGPAVVDLPNHFGGPGGLGALTGASFISNTPICAGAGHSASGEAGKNPNGRALGAPGVAYGVDDATKLTMGSGASGNITCSGSAVSPHLVDHVELLAGGIVLLVTDHVDIGTTGVVTASANTAARDIGASGGYVFVTGTVLNLGTDRVSALGGVATSVGGPDIGMTVQSSDGYVVVKGTTVTGTTKPIAHAL